ncbi:uncharacterized protein EI97DRAFT_474463 [Westerdykella ornata]|uniref:Fe2OG dioxygenase domain-containing protein n=1 Tax=Westerdykella ornata TaxID=318751 RepID=A0A6A6JHI6_WESOR|nr:uncharacterized protein EI97DRAFT_474463 [Westerdykella ornata]KAF2275872.1 hypothetical protein EI97DRAFT_474463 [Westerdykella ornata]
MDFISVAFCTGTDEPSQDPADDHNGGAQDLTVKPFNLRWDSSGSSSGSFKINFPIGDEQHGSLLRLIQDCQPASFGYKGDDVNDESYRKAAKMDRSAFCVDFCPYEVGIIDTIAQVLLPNAASNIATHGVKAELYKLNIYSALSGFFKTHVDTPRSETQFGSLVVSLPCHHEGGQLVVRHAGNSLTFDWGNSGSGGKTSTSIQWAAFYSDCEHEVLEVTEGHRVTLTYNLYYAPGVGDLAVNSPAMDVKTLPLYKKLQDALRDRSFMTEGGYLGIFCQHAYAHSTVEGVKSLPAVLKGADMAVYTIFKALDLPTSIRPFLYIDDWYHPTFDWRSQRLSDTSTTYVGGKMRPLVITERGGEGDGPDDILPSFEGDWLKVNWLIKPVKDTACVNLIHLTYGNQAGIDCVYSYAALIVTIPPASERVPA